MKNEIVNAYSMTREEYYLSQGLSGSKIDRPNDLVDDVLQSMYKVLKVLWKD